MPAQCDLRLCKACLCEKGIDQFSATNRIKGGIALSCKWCERFKMEQLKSLPEYVERRAEICRRYYEKKKRLSGYVPHSDRKERICGTCKSDKPLSEFRNDKKGINGKGHICRECAKINARKWYRSNRKRAVSATAQWRIKNREKTRSYAAKFWRAHKTDPCYRLKYVMRTAVGRSLRDRKETGAYKLLGYSISELAGHLERQFSKGMNWNNYGKVWHIDHIVPLSSFHYETPDDDEFKRAWHITNLRPLMAKENIAKGNKLVFLI